MHQQSLMLLHPMVKKKMHLQENTLFDIDLGVKVTQNVAQYPRHHVEEKMHLQENTLNVAQCPLHHVTNAPTEFEVTTSKA